MPRGKPFRLSFLSGRIVNVASLLRRSPQLDDGFTIRKRAFATTIMNGRIGHTREVQGLHSLTAAFEDGADRRTLSFIPG
jgi:hypothetical protein